MPKVARDISIVMPLGRAKDVAHVRGNKRALEDYPFNPHEGNPEWNRFMATVPYNSSMQVDVAKLNSTQRQKLKPHSFVQDPEMKPYPFCKVCHSTSGDFVHSSNWARRYSEVQGKDAGKPSDWMCGLCGKRPGSKFIAKGTEDEHVVCSECAKTAKDDLSPVGAEDPERAIALKKHEEGITVSQDRVVRPVGDDFAKWEKLDKEMDGIQEELGKFTGKASSSPAAEKLRKRLKELARQKQAQDVKPVGDANRAVSETEKINPEVRQIEKTIWDLFNKAYERWTASGEKGNLLTKQEDTKWKQLDKRLNTMGYEFNDDHGLLKITGPRGKDTELPTAVKPVGLVPLPSGQENEVSYAPRKVAKDEDDLEELCKLCGEELGAHSPANVCPRLDTPMPQFRKDGQKFKPSGKKAYDGESKDAKSQWQPDSEDHAKLDQLHSEVTGKGYKHKYTAGGGQGVMQHVYRKGGSENNRPTAIIHEAKSGNHTMNYTNQSKPKTKEELAARTTDSMPKWQPDSPNKDKLIREHERLTGKAYKYKHTTSGRKPGELVHVYRIDEGHRKGQTAKFSERANGSHSTFEESAMANDAQSHFNRAVQYEIANDRARALDSYRAAANGFRSSGDHTRETQARDGIAACQTKFAQEYQHPGHGKTKVCDSADAALRTALERTRAGERVYVDGKTVRVGDADATSEKQWYVTAKKTTESNVLFSVIKVKASSAKEARSKAAPQIKEGFKVVIVEPAGNQSMSSKDAVDALKPEASGWYKLTLDDPHDLDIAQEYGVPAAKKGDTVWHNPNTGRYKPLSAMHDAKGKDSKVVRPV